MTELEKKVRSKILKTVLSRSDKTYAKQALDYINELEEQLNLHDVMCSKFLVFDFKKDIKFWALIPCVNINLHSKEFELEWLCFGLYVRKPFK